MSAASDLPLRYSASNPNPRFERFERVDWRRSAEKLRVTYNWKLGAWVRLEQFTAQVFRFVRTMHTIGGTPRDLRAGAVLPGEWRGEWQVCAVLRRQLP